MANLQGIVWQVRQSRVSRFTQESEAIDTIFQVFMDDVKALGEVQVQCNPEVFQTREEIDDAVEKIELRNHRAEHVVLFAGDISGKPSVSPVYIITSAAVHLVAMSGSRFTSERGRSNRLVQAVTNRVELSGVCSSYSCMN